ncbi:hypothetical protein [Paraflavitalea sp. CAU 1676]|uniref:hypothetical protein n=1 Tax=Paraflavitalea sp. CAU 1676 TaxID=3032598 RepID=UPI0023DB9405|nr:hypothetical protein [Paraflavitalea sp. CAU 1676]MDF2190331.1 hypothetical protein [Paraflavitalea sp. CAU 1676]
MEKRVIFRCFAVLFYSLHFGCASETVHEAKYYFDYYDHDTIVPNRALVIRYEYPPGTKYRRVRIEPLIGGDSIRFNEIISDSGIYRSKDTTGFALSHSFARTGDVLSDYEKVVPFFVYQMTKRFATKSYYDRSGDSLSVVFFDEASPRYSYVNSYFVKGFNCFIAFYDPIEQSYFKLSKVSGLKSGSVELVELSEKVIRDSTFFGKYYKFPETIPPPPTAKD